MAGSTATRSAAAAVAAASAAAVRRAVSGGHLALNGGFASAACSSGVLQRCAAAALVSRRPLSSMLPRREPRHHFRFSPIARAVPTSLVSAFPGSGRSRPISSWRNLKRILPENPVFHSLIFLIIAMCGASWYFGEEKKRMAAKREEAQMKATASSGKPKIGGPFTLIDTEGKTVTNEDFLGQYLLVYFGFTHCPDICPEELEKMTDVVDLLRANPVMGKKVTPIFITCDPQRDGIEEVKEYVKDFHPDLVGLTGTFSQVASAAKAYRIYFSAPPGVAPGDDYLVDHSIFFYFMDPHGEFLDAYSREWLPGQVAQSIENHVKRYLADGGAEGREAVLRQRAERARAKEDDPAEESSVSARIGAPVKSLI